MIETDIRGFCPDIARPPARHEHFDWHRKTAEGSPEGVAPGNRAHAGTPADECVASFCRFRGRDQEMLENVTTAAPVPDCATAEMPKLLCTTVTGNESPLPLYVSESVS